MDSTKQRIVILGGGFTGVKTALELLNKTNPATTEIVLIDERGVNIYTPDLYEIATAYNKKITEECLTELKETVAVPLSKIFAGKPVEIIRGKVSVIEPELKKILLNNEKIIEFHYLVIALGSVTNYYGIPGLAQFSYPLKTLPDALAINCHLDTYFQTLWKKEVKKSVSIVVGGGGFTGVEFACELVGYVKRLCQKYQYPYEQVKITVVEGSEKLAAQSEKTTAIIKERLTTLGIAIRLSTFIKNVTAGKIEVESVGHDHETLTSDILIWTGGVMPNPLIVEHFKNVAKNGALPVNQFLQHETFSRIFAAGDNAFIIDSANGKPVPMLAQTALQEAHIISQNIFAEITQGEKKSFEPKLKGMIIPLGGKYALYKKSSDENSFMMKGFFVWMMRRIVDLRYALSILPFFYALRKWLRATEIFMEND